MSSSFGSEGCGQSMYGVVCDAYGRCDDIPAEAYPLPVMVDIICCVNDSIIPCMHMHLVVSPLSRCFSMQQFSLQLHSFQLPLVMSIITIGGGGSY